MRDKKGYILMLLCLPMLVLMSGCFYTMGVLQDARQTIADRDDDVTPVQVSTWDAANEDRGETGKALLKDAVIIGVGSYVIQRFHDHEKEASEDSGGVHNEGGDGNTFNVIYNEGAGRAWIDQGERVE